MNRIVTATEVKSYKDIGSNTPNHKPDNENKINDVIDEAQLIEVKNHLGDNFYFDIIANLSTPEYQDLLTGCTFTYNSVTYSHDGLKALTADYFMSRYVLTVNTNFTSFGAISTAKENSTPVERNTLKDKSTQQLQLAGARWEVIKKYLDTQSFQQWKKNNACVIPSSERESRYSKI